MAELDSITNIPCITQDDIDRLEQLPDYRKMNEMMDKYYKPFYKKYKNFEFDENFISDGKLIFSYILKDMEKITPEEFDDSDDETDIEASMKSINDLMEKIKVIVELIDSLNISNPSDIFMENLSAVFDFFKKSNDEIEEVNKTIKDGFDLVDDGVNRLKRTIVLSDIVRGNMNFINLIKNMLERGVNVDTAEKEQIVKCLNDCENSLKSFDQDDVNTVLLDIENDDANYEFVSEGNNNNRKLADYKMIHSFVIQKRYLNVLKNKCDIQIEPTTITSNLGDLKIAQ